MTGPVRSIPDKRANGSRPRGRPRVAIDRDAVADAVAELYHEGGYEAVSIVDTAAKLSISRATLYRTVPTKNDLLGILLERCTRDITDQVRQVIADVSDPAEQLEQMIRLQVDAAVEMRSYMPVFFGGGDLPADVVSRWHAWTRRFEKMWVKVVADNIAAGYLDESDPLLTTRLIFGMTLWVCRWYRPSEKITSDQIADAAVHLVRGKLGAAPSVGGLPGSGGAAKRAPQRRRAVTGK